MVLKGQTPADKAGIKIEWERRWLTLAQDVSKKQDVKA
jgi:hypothetical protein